MKNSDKKKIISIYTFHLDIQESNAISTMDDLQSSDAVNCPEDLSIESDQSTHSENVLELNEEKQL